MQKINQDIALVYCADNQAVALKIEADLAGVINFIHHACCRDGQTHITETLQGFQGAVLLLISDNYLRTAQCMRQGLSMLNEHQDKLLPVVIAGYRLDEEGERQTVLANFSRFKQIVQYINYWQDRYLELRQKKRTDPDLDNEGFATYLHTIRDIAGEAGQYLRSLQLIDMLDQAAFSNHSYKVLFEFLEEEEVWEAFKMPDEQAPELTEDDDVNIDPVPDTERSEGHTVSMPEATVTETSPEGDLPKKPAIQVTEQTPSDEKETIAAIINSAWDTEDQTLAIEALEAAIEKYPDNKSLRYNLAVLYIQNSAYDRAEKEVEVLLGYTQEEEVLFLAGELADLQAKKKEALKYFQKLAEVNEDYPDIFYILGLLTQRNTPNAVAQIEYYFKKALQKNKKSSFANYELALLCLKNAESDKAEKYLKRTLKLDADHPFAQYDLALLFHQNASFKKAHKHYQKAILVNPELKTEANDLAFSKKNKTVEDKKDTIKALKNKIEQLEALLAAKEGV